ncbi:TonB-dependent receptor [Labilibacter sediminis]|nr:TonB-dependent receptor [Labilibacter sediminis]
MKKILSLWVLLMMIGTSAIWAQTVTVSGTVRDNTTKEPMIGVTVLIKGTTIGTITSYDGTYSLQVSDTIKTLSYSFIGFETQDIPFSGQVKIDVLLTLDTEDLEEVVITSYGIQKKGTYTGSVEIVDAKKIEQVPVVGFDQALQGQAPGVLSVSSSGAPGSSATIRIRGVSSVNAGNDPLYIMDGIQITSGQFSSINTNDIESISILKDATATALYGSRASNGVIVITTKRGGFNEQTVVKYRGQYGLSQVANDNFEMMSTVQKIQYEEETGNKTYTPEEKLELMKHNTNWFDEVMHNALSQSHEISASGGSDKTRFFVSGGYYFKDGILDRSDFERMTFRLNLDNKMSDKANFGINMMVGYEEKNNTNTISNSLLNPVFAARMLNPYLYNKNPDGSYNQEGFPSEVNPLEELSLNDNKSNTLKIVGGVFFDVHLLNNLVFKSNLGVDFYDYTAKSYMSPESFGGSGQKGSVANVFSRNFRVTPTNTLKYKLSVNEAHNFDFLLGQEAVANYYTSMSVSAKGMPNDYLKVVDVAAETGSWGGNGSSYTLASFFANMNYNYNYKYLLDLSIRRDGSSRFGINNRWGTFWSVGLGWNLQEEYFIKDISWIDQLKLRGSIGETGNYNIGNYEHLGLFSYGSYMNQGASFFTQYANDDLTWEKKMKANLAIDFAFLRKFRTKLEVYNELTTDMLFFVPYSHTSGVNGRMENIGEMNNKGIEFEIDATIIQNNNFTFNLNANVAYNRNEITKLYNGLEEIDQQFTKMTVGEPLGTFYLTRWAGVDASTGKGLWYKADGSVTDTYSDSDRVLTEGKSYLPPLTGGFRTNFAYKNLQLSAFFTWMADKWIVNNTRYFIESQGMFTNYNQSVEMLDYWKQPGDVAKHPDPKYQDNQFDTRLLENASFIRLKNLTLSYDVNSSWLKKTLFFQNARLYVQGQNLFTVTGYTGIDPEVYGVNELNMYPNVKTYTIGLDLSF